MFIVVKLFLRRTLYGFLTLGGFAAILNYNNARRIRAQREIPVQIWNPDGSISVCTLYDLNEATYKNSNIPSTFIEWIQWIGS